MATAFLMYGDGTNTYTNVGGTVTNLGAGASYTVPAGQRLTVVPAEYQTQFTQVFKSGAGARALASNGSATIYSVRPLILPAGATLALGTTSAAVSGILEADV